MNTSSVEKVAFGGRYNVLMALALVILVLAGLYYGGGWLNEPYDSWSMKASLFFVASILMVGVTAALGSYVLKSADRPTTASLKNLRMATLCFAISSAIGSILIVLTTSDQPVSSFAFSLYAAMILILAFGAFSLGVHSVQTLRGSGH